jgi:DNA-binding GntR family transcriptional regulator
MSIIILDRAERSGGRCTLVERLRRRLADEIMAGALAPGAALDETELAGRFHVSRTPVREAIRLLEASGLVNARPHRSAVVARPSEERLNGMFEAMAELEALCAAFAAERMTRPERQALEGIHETLRALIQSGDPERYHEVNEAFHGAIYAGAHNDYLAELTLATRVRVAPFRRAQFRNIGRLAKSHAEHDRVMTAIMRGERMRASEAMRAHIRTVHQEYEALRQSGVTSVSPVSRPA